MSILVKELKSKYPVEYNIYETFKSMNIDNLDTLIDAVTSPGLQITNTPLPFSI